MRNSLCATIIALLGCLMFAAVVLPAVAPPPISEVLAWGYFDGIDTPWHLPNGGTFTFRGWVQDKGYIVSTDTEVFPDGVITLSRLQDFRFILLNSWLLADPASSIYVDTVVEYVNQGGGLIIFGEYGDPQMTLDDALGFQWPGSSPGPVDPWSFYVHASITDPSHPVMQGLTDLPRSGGVFVDWDSLINDAPLPAGTAVLARSTGTGGIYDPVDKIALIAFQYGNGRVVVGPGHGLMRPYAPTNVNEMHVIGEPIVENKLLINAMEWVASPLRYELSVNSSPIAGIPFAIDGTAKTTPYTELLSEGSYVLEMPIAFNGYTWSHWLEDGDTSRIKTINIVADPTWTAVYTPTGPPAPSVGGEWAPINTVQLVTPWIALVFLAVAFAAAGSHRLLKKRM